MFPKIAMFTCVPFYCINCVHPEHRIMMTFWATTCLINRKKGRNINSSAVYISNMMWGVTQILLLRINRVLSHIKLSMFSRNVVFPSWFLINQERSQLFRGAITQICGCHKAVFIVIVIKGESGGRNSTENEWYASGIIWFDGFRCTIIEPQSSVDTDLIIVIVLFMSAICRNSAVPFILPEPQANIVAGTLSRSLLVTLVDTTF